MVNLKLWARKKLLKKLRAKKRWANMESNKDVKIFVTGVAMAGESQLNEHNRTVKEDKAKPEGNEISDSREDGRRQGN
tara:strand:- start:330 stop:563 length:234 start_codon:yes stop_codon:yes gene_type:complete